MAYQPRFTISSRLLALVEQIAALRVITAVCRQRNCGPR